VGAFDVGAWFFATAVSTLRTEGRLGLLARALVLQSRSAIHLGHLDLALTAAEEGGRLALELRDPLFAAGARSALAIIAGLRGDQARAEAHAEAAEQGGLPAKAKPVLASALYARGLSALADGRHSDAYDHLYRLFDPQDPASHPGEASWAIGDLAEAAVHAGTAAEAREVLGRVEPLVGDVRGTRGAVAVSCARALLTDDRDAEHAFAAALDTDLQAWPFDRARLLLAYGAWLRRQRRVAESRPPLRTARETFDAIGTVPWAERARQELRASGETSRSRTPEARERLTPQELQIAQMAAEGLTNRQIGEKLYLSHRTVGSHLYRMYPKLGITARGQLLASLQGGQ
jgi:ATP/maltotriose-dependent transcriptional regulator MalT